MTPAPTPTLPSSSNEPPSPLRIARIVELAAWAFAALGATLPAALHTPALSMYREALLAGTGVASLAEHERLLGLVVGITGGSIAGKWLMHVAIARWGLASGQRWAMDATIVGLLGWFAIDTGASLMVGAWWNAAFVNGVPLLVVGAPLLVARRARGRTVELPPPVPALQRPVRAVLWTSGIGIGSGLLIAFAGDTPVFEPWFSGLASAGIDASPPARALALSFFGPIGGCVAAQFAMIVLVAHGPLRAGARWAAPACIASILGWFLIDSTWGLVHGGLFNIAMVNVPTVLLTVPPLWWAHRVARGREAR